MCGTLWVVATPLGNIEDISLRAKKTLAHVDILLAEDTRNTRKLLSLLDIHVDNVWSFHNYTEEGKLDSICALLQEGKDIALVSDAGMPTISDPGYLLVSACHKKHITVSVIPGASSVITALAGSGIAPIPSTFIGFLPKTAGDKKKIFERFRTFDSSIICFERKNRVLESLEIAYSILGDRDICIARELTKLYEEYICTSLGKVQDCLQAQELLGEVTLVIGKAKEKYITPIEDIYALYQTHNTEQNIRGIIKHILEESSGYTAKELYAILENFKKL